VVDLSDAENCKALESQISKALSCEMLRYSVVFNFCNSDVQLSCCES